MILVHFLFSWQCWVFLLVMLFVTGFIAKASGMYRYRATITGWHTGILATVAFWFGIVSALSFRM